MNINFSLGNQRVAELKSQENMYMYYLKRQQMIINALQHNSFRQHSFPAPIAVLPPAPVPAPTFVPVPAPAPAPVVQVNNEKHAVHIKKKFNSLLSKMNEQKRK
jgi:hypothetical protein